MTLSSKPARHFSVLAIVSALVVLVAAPACGGLSSDCSNFCDRWRECVDGTVSVDTCEDSCKSWADGNSERESKVDKCSECLSQNDACSDTTRRCTADCLGIPVR